MVFGLKDFILGSVCFAFICVLSCLMGQKKIVLKYIIFYLVIAAIQQLCVYLPQAIETILSIFTLFIRVMIPVVLFASTFIATTKVSELIAAMYSLKIPRSITITFAMVLRFFPTFSEEIHNIYDAMKLRGIALSLRNVLTRPLLTASTKAVVGNAGRQRRDKGVSVYSGIQTYGAGLKRAENQDQHPKSISAQNGC